MPRSSRRSSPSGRSAPAGLVVGLGLAAIGAGLLFLASTTAEAAVRTARTALPLNAGAVDGTDARAHNSPTVVRNPTDRSNVVVVDRVDSPQYACAVHVSGDGGATWRESRVPFPAGEELPERCFAPDAAFGPDGTLYLVFATLAGQGNSPHAVWLATSADGGRNLTTPVHLVGPMAFQVRVLADAARPGTVYVSWLQADGLGFVSFQNTGNPVSLMRSEDGGRTWTDPVRVSPPSRARVVAPSLAQGRGGDLFALYLDLGEDRLDYHGGHEWTGGDPYDGEWQLVLARSGDKGATWSETVVDQHVVPIQRVMIFLPASPTLAVDEARGMVYVAFHDGRGGDADVLLWRSADRGASFSPPVRVNDTGPADGTWQYLPRLGVSPDGRLDVAYYDRRNDSANIDNNVSFQSSFDQGRSFTPSRSLSDRGFDSRVGFGSSRGMPDLGTRLGLLADDDQSLVAWSDTRRGSGPAIRQDLALGRVGITEGSDWRDRLSYAGMAVIVLGVVAGFAGLARRRRPAAPAEAPEEAPEGAAEGDVLVD